MFDKLNEECGVFGVFSRDEHVNVVDETYMGLYALQHRGQESCGIAVNDGGVILCHKDLGLVSEAFNATILDHLNCGKIAVGHVRYSTTGTANRENAQPLVTKYVKGHIALAHNGNLTNAGELRSQLERQGVVFETTNDSEVLCHMITQKRFESSSVEEAIVKMMDVVEGAYSIVAMGEKKLIAARDPHGFRPLCMGKIGNSVVFASESCALDSIGAQFVRDVEPGEVVTVTEDGVTSTRHEAASKTSLCIFEFIYFARPDSVIDGSSVYLARQEAGKYLARQSPVEADIVCGVPDSGLDAALGYARESEIAYGTAFIKNRYIGRTFIQSSQRQREHSVKIKLNALKASVEGKRVVLIDDSIVRGTTSAKIIQMLKDSGAKEVHMRISAPPFKNPCYFGTDVDSRENLIACHMSVEEIRQKIGADSLDYLSIENMRKIAIGCGRGLCEGCFTGVYPIEVPEEDHKDQFERGR